MDHVLFFSENSRQVSFKLKYMKILLFISSMEHLLISFHHLDDITLKMYSHYADVPGNEAQMKLF